MKKIEASKFSSSEIPADCVCVRGDVEAGFFICYQVGDALPAPLVFAPESVSVSPRQIRLALTATGLCTTVENAVKAGSQDLKDWWEYALEIERHHPLIEAMGAALGKSSDDLDNLWRLAATL